MEPQVKRCFCNSCGYTLPFVDGQVIFGAIAISLARLRGMHRCAVVRGGRAVGPAQEFTVAS